MTESEAEVWRNWAREAPEEALRYFLPADTDRPKRVRSLSDLEELLEQGCKITITIEQD